MKSKIYYEGYRAYGMGKIFNPYSHADDESAEEWQQGFDAAEDDEAILEHERKYARRGVEWQ